MEFRRFTAENMEKGMAAVREALGEDAVILDSFETGDNGVEIFAAQETPPEDGIPIITSIEKFPSGAKNTLGGKRLTDLIPEEVQAELFVLRKSLRRELVELRQYREKKMKEDGQPDPVTLRLQEKLEGLQTTLERELTELSRYRAEREQTDAEIYPATRELQSSLASMQQSLKEELTRLTDYRQKREALDAELDPATSKRWSELNELQECLARELTRLHEYRLERAEIDAESDPVTKALQVELGKLQQSLSEELNDLTAYRMQRREFDAECDPLTRKLHTDLSDLQNRLTEEANRLAEYRELRKQFDAETDPVTRSLQAGLGEMQKSLKAELIELQNYREQRIRFDADTDPVTRTLQSDLGELRDNLQHLQADLDGELSRLSVWREQRMKLDEELDPQHGKLQESLNTLQNALKTELDHLQEYRSRREETDARLDPLTKGLHQELTKLQGSLRRELVQLSRQREIQEKLVTEQTEAARIMATELQKLRQAQSSSTPDQAVLMELRHEMNAMKDAFLAELGKLTTGNDTPARTAGSESGDETRKPRIEGRYRTLHLSDEIMESLLERLPEKSGVTPGWKTVLETLGSMLNTGSDEILTKGGIVAVLGSTGVGKTTTVAKLAEQYIRRHGSGKVAIISTDSLRIGGAGQLDHFARNLEIPLASATDTSSLESKIHEFSDFELVLIDTAGINHRDLELAGYLQSLMNPGSGVTGYVVLSATSDPALMRETIQALQCIPLRGAIITKIDEASTLGPVISSVISEKLPVGYLCNGRLIPEDIVIATRAELLLNCKRLAQQPANRRKKETAKARRRA